MPACSTACSVPGHLLAVIEPAPREHVVVDRVPERPGHEPGRRQVERLGPSTCRVRGVAPLVADDLARHLHRAEVQLARGRSRRVASVARIGTFVSDATWVYSSPSTGSTMAARSSRSSVTTRNGWPWCR